ncbi:MAG: hypothetical protein EOO07_10355, partial [Chitinophagaceae bacterium]
MKKYLNNTLLLFVAFLLPLYYSCKKFDNPPAVFEELKQLNTVQRKVLVISIDGLTGAELKTIAPPAIEELKKTGKYSYDLTRGAVANDAASWASMLTGTSYGKHNIEKDDFLPTPSSDSHDVPTVYRNMFDYILQYKSLKTAVVSPWANLRNYLKIADFNPIVSTDLAVKDSTLNLIKAQTQVGAIIVNFRDVLAAGANGGYLATNDTYKNAVLKADEYVGNIVAAVKARKTYANEDWLIIITTNHGGSNTNPQPGFLIASQKDIKSAVVKKRGFNIISFNSTDIYAEVVSDNGLYDSGANGDFTVQMQVKTSKSSSYPIWLSKGSPVVGWTDQTGWVWMQGGTSLGISIGGAINNGGANRVQTGISPAGISVNDGKWHTYTMSVAYVNATTRTVTTYFDGVQASTLNISTQKSISIPTKGLRIGANGTSTSDFVAANLLYFNKALSAAVISANLDRKKAEMASHPDYANLVGYWPMDEGIDNIFNNFAATGYN